MTVVASTLLAAQRFSAALELVDGDAGRALPPGEGDLVRANALAGLERHRAAHELCGKILRADPTPLLRARALALEARLLRRASPLVDDALESALEAAAVGERLAASDPGARDVAGEARLEAAHLYARKRCQTLAQRELGGAAALLGAGDARVRFAEGHVLSAFDDRAGARERFEAALASGTPLGKRLGRLGLAHVAMLVGEFDRAHGHLNALDELAPEDLPPRRIRVRVLAAEQRWEPAAAVLAEIVAGSPDADSAPMDRYEAAAALLRAGQPAAAMAAWKAQVEAGPADAYWVKRARRCLELLTRPPSPERRKKRLAEFPSVAQLRNHCGPASVELYLRFFGLTASQLEVARQIKDGDGGTPVYRMRRFLEAAGFVCRRVEADLPQLRCFIDAGIPVIMEEDYSDSRHVAVAIGYDDEREILEVQDPMSHEVRETPYEDLAGLRNLSNHGALVGVPGADPARVAALEKAGGVECRYISLVDEAWAARDAGAPDEGLRLAREAIALRRDYELAWLYEFHHARDVAEKSGGAEDKAKLHEIVDTICGLWPDDEWPQQLLGEVRYVDGRYDEARDAFERARDRDPGDAHNWSMIADCHLAVGRHDDAAAALEQALRRNPAHRRANENLAHQRFRQGRTRAAWILNDVARELGPKNPYNHGVHALLLAGAGDLGGAVAAYDRALALDPGRIGHHIERARLLARLGRGDEAHAAIATIAGKRPDDVGLRVDWADLLYTGGKHAEAVDVCKDVLARQADHAAGHAIMGAALCALGKLDEGLAAMRRALGTWPSYAWVHSEMGRHLSTDGRHVDAIQAHAAAYGLVGRADYQLGLARALEKAGARADAARHARQAALSGGLREADLDVAAGLVMADQGPHAVHGLFEDLARRCPGDLGVHRAHARFLLETVWAPGAAEAPLARIAELRPEDPYARAERGAKLMARSLADEAEGERLLREAVADAGKGVFARRLLARELRVRGRFAEALEVMAPTASDYQNDHERLLALLALERVADAEALVAAFEAPRRKPGEPLVGAMVMRYRIARHGGDLRAALALAEQISRLYHEREDDGRVDAWEQEKLDCLTRLGELERAQHWAEHVARDAGGLATLSHTALSAGAPTLAETLAERAERLEPDEATALHVLARCAELAGDTARALVLWRRLGDVSDWHIWREEVSRLSLGLGDLEQATELAESAVAAAGGHVCPWTFAARAQARFVRGDADGARADLERAWALAGVATGRRDPARQDAWALRAFLAGDTAAAVERWKEYLAAPVVSIADRARVSRIRELARC